MLHIKISKFTLVNLKNNENRQNRNFCYTYNKNVFKYQLLKKGHLFNYDHDKYPMFDLRTLTFPC